MEIGSQMEQFSLAYVRAVAAVAGYSTYAPAVDDDSIDLLIASRGGGGTTRSPRVELQLKCSARGLLGKSDIRFPLSRKNYDDLRPANVLVPRLLVVVLVPRMARDWIACSEKQLVLRRCGYWASLRGLPTRERSSSVTVRIPRRQVFSPRNLQTLMENVANGGAA